MVFGPSTTDANCIHGMAQQEEEAFTAFYDRHATVVFSFLRRMLTEATDREDVLQETFWQVWRQAENYDPSRGSPLAWLIQIARSRAQDRLRQIWTSNRRDAGSIDTLIGEMDASLHGSNLAKVSNLAAFTSPHDPHLEESSQRVRNALLGIPSEQRETLTLAYLFGLTHLEIAERLKIPVGTIKSRIRLGIHKLRDLLEKS